LDLTRREVRFWQEKVCVRFGESFTLHPGQLVLAAALEYISMPCGLAASVITRSSYGRLGLITATAVHVHPGYKGCVTLELYNFGDTPVVLYPALPIAQFVFIHVSPQQIPFQSKYTLPTETEFPKIWEDDCITRLKKMRDYFDRTQKTTE